MCVIPIGLAYRAAALSACAWLASTTGQWESVLTNKNGIEWKGIESQKGPVII